MFVRKRMCIVGTGYIGVASAIGFAELRHDVVGYDVIAERVQALAQGIPPYREEGLADRLQEHLAAGRLRFVARLTEAIEGADYVFVCVGTPARSDGSADLTALEAVVDDLRRLPLRDATVVLRSTVPCGTTDRVAEALRSHVNVLFVPEFLREGHALDDFLHPDRVVIGAREDVEAIDLATVFAPLGARAIITGYREAELIKAFSNGFLAMKVSFANEVANLCDGLGADALAVLHGIGADGRIGSRFLQPGIGFGGPCFEKDLKSVRFQAASAGVPARLVQATLAVNEHQQALTVDLVEAELGTLCGRRVAVWGLTFKAGTDDVRDSLATRIVEELRTRGAHVVAHDPAIIDVHPMVPCETVREPLAAARGADALLVLTEWPQFADVEPSAIRSALRGTVVVDGRNVLDANALIAHGLAYRGVGRHCLIGASAPAPIGLAS